MRGAHIRRGAGAGLRARHNGGGDGNEPANGRGAVTDRVDTTETRNPPPESSPVPALEEAWERTGGVRRRGEVFAIRRGRRWTCAQAGARSAEARRSPQAGACTGNTPPQPTGRGSESARLGDTHRMGDQPLAVGGIDRQFADPG